MPDQKILDKYQYFLYDWDGCLVKSLDMWLSSYKEIFAEYNIYPKDREITKQVFGDWNGPLKFGIQDIKEYNQKLISLVNSKLQNAKAYPGAERTLKKLKLKSKKIALLTAAKKENLAKALYKTGLNIYFDFVITADDVSKHKPDPEVINIALNKFNAKKENAVYTGDTEQDIIAAQNAKISSILFFPKSHQNFYNFTHLKSLNPTYIITKHAEMLEK